MSAPARSPGFGGERPGPNDRPPEPWPFALGAGDMATIREVVAPAWHGYGSNPRAAEMGKDPWEACLLGAVGELAVARHFGVEVDWSLGRPDDGADVWVDGRSIQVKSATIPGAFLLLDRREKARADFFCLVAGVRAERGTGMIVGMCKAERLLAQPLERWPKPAKETRALPPWRLSEVPPPFCAERAGSPR